MAGYSDTYPTPDGNRYRSLLIILGITLCLVNSANADWPHLRGPNYDSVSTETGLADSWSREGPPRLWVRELGQGHSGFIVGENKIYTQRQTLGGQFLLCLDPETGETIWEARYDWAWQPKGAYPGPYATPTYYRGKVYYASPSGLVGCLDAKTGADI
jgi:outer membrane protein assembly factor BamB